MSRILQPEPVIPQDLLPEAGKTVYIGGVALTRLGERVIVQVGPMMQSLDAADAGLLALALDAAGAEAHTFKEQHHAHAA